MANETIMRQLHITDPKNYDAYVDARAELEIRGYRIKRSGRFFDVVKGAYERELDVWGLISLAERIANEEARRNHASRR